MNSTNLMHPTPRSKKIIGGALAEAIFSPGGLASRFRSLRAVRAHNTADRTHTIGRPMMEHDGTRTYRVATIGEVQQ